MKQFVKKYLFLIFNFIDFLSNKKFFYILFEKFHEKSYIVKKIKDNKTKFFVPNSLINWRVKTIFSQEPETINWIDGFKKKSIFWDIGANIGLYSIYAASVHDQLEIVSFEPSTSNLRVLSRNISINNLENRIMINQFALSNYKNSYKVFKETEFSEGGSMNTFAHNIDFEGKKILPKQKYRIYGTSIDYLLDEKILTCPNYVKIDVDGIEHKILQSASKMLKNKNLKSLLIEINEKYKEQYNLVIKIMSKYKFIANKMPQLDKYKKTKFSKTYNYIFTRND